MNANNGWSSSVTIFNAGSVATTISLDYDGQGGPYAGPQNVSLESNASVTYDQSGSACPLVGAGRVRSSNGQPLAVTVRQVHSGGMTMAYNGFSAGASTVAVPLIMIGAEGSTSPGLPPAGPFRIYMPLAMAGNRGWNATLAVQNLGAAQTDITVSYYPSSGYGALASQTAYNVQPHTTAIFAPSATGLWTGAARITNSADQPVAAVVNKTNSSQAMSYNGFLDGSSAIVLPDVRNDGGWTTSVQVQNLDASAADVVVKVNGGQVWSGTINAYSSVTIPLSAGNGSATVECTNGKRIAAIVTATGVGPGDQNGDYNGINR